MDKALRILSTKQLHGQHQTTGANRLAWVLWAVLYGKYTNMGILGFTLFSVEC